MSDLETLKAMLAKAPGGIYRKWAAPDLAHSRNRGLGVAKRGGGTGVPAWIFANAPWP